VFFSEQELLLPSQELLGLLFQLENDGVIWFVHTAAQKFMSLCR
jgi:hypothetical protein